MEGKGMSVLTDTFLGDRDMLLLPQASSVILLGGGDSPYANILSAVTSVDPGRLGRMQLGFI